MPGVPATGQAVPGGEGPAHLLLPARRQEPARRRKQEVSMTAVTVALYPTRPAEEAVPEVTVPVMAGLDQVIESTTCSCNAGDDNPHGPARRGQSQRVPGVSRARDPL